MIHYFVDPIYQASLFGTMLMALSCSFLGVFLVLERRSLIVETLSHAAYPGVALGLIFSGGAIICGGLFTVLLALWMIGRLEKSHRVASDPALCFTMSAFLGVGALLASYLQGVSPVLSKKMDSFLFGQAATMFSSHVRIYLILALAVIGWIVLNFHSLKGRAFDRSFARLEGAWVRTLDMGMTLLVALAIVVGVRCVGVVLMAGMIIAPAVASRHWVRSLGALLVLAGCFGVGSALAGNLIAFEYHISAGPVIVCLGTSSALLSLLIAFCLREVRKLRFRSKCSQENVLKLLWKGGDIALASRFALWRARQKGLVTAQGELTELGREKGSQIVRLHRLWELYLSSNLNFGIHNVHPSAEEMEHILTPELERELTRVLGNPSSDPHKQPIPGGVI